MKTELQKHVERARVRIIANQPFFGSLVMKLPIEINDSISTAATDGVKIYLSTDFALSLPVDELAGVFMHEICHVAFKHTLRRGDRDPKDWNIAADYAINPICKKSGAVLPDSALLDAKYDGMSVEDIYKDIHIDLPPEDKGQGEGEQSGDGTSSPDNKSPESCPDDGGCGGVMDAPTISKGEDAPAGTKEVQVSGDTGQEVAVQAIDDIDIRQADNAERMGKGKSNFTGSIDELLKPKQDWRSLLREYLQPAKDDYSYRRFNRRIQSEDIIFPGLDGEETGELVLAVDTSGSVGHKQLQQFCSEIQAIVDDTQPSKITVIYNDYGKVADSAVHEFEKGDELTFNYVGGGGTDLNPAFDYVEEQQIQPECFVYMTDLYVDARHIPSVAPDYPVVWLSCGDAELPHGSPAIGEVVHAHDVAA